MRTFVSLELPENVQAQIFHAFEKLRISKLCNAKFVPKNNIQLTLKFIGNVNEEQVEKIKKALKEIDFRQFPIETGNVIYFPNRDYVRTLSLELVASDLEFLKEELDKKLKEIDINENDKKFVAHVTIARIKSVKDKDLFFEKISEIKPGKLFFIADEFQLTKSILKKKGPEYKALEKYSMRRRI